jgi:hypothetical protein
MQKQKVYKFRGIDNLYADESGNFFFNHFNHNSDHNSDISHHFIHNSDQNFNISGQNFQYSGQSL